VISAVKTFVRKMDSSRMDMKSALPSDSVYKMRILRALTLLD
jgi:hypothetical protein